MVKKLVFETISLGTEPEIPDAAELAQWVGMQRGKNADLLSHLLEASLTPQIDAGIIHPCTGGIFYGDRWKESLLGLSGDEITGELGVNPSYVADDAIRIRKITSGCRIAVPAPHTISLADRYYHDEDEVCHALYTQYRHLFRTMRDNGISGHVLSCEKPLPEELEALAGKRVFFFSESRDAESMAMLLEYQRAIAVNGRDLAILRGLGEEYEIDRIILIDPDNDDIKEVLRNYDPDCIQVGGYCSAGDEKYWENLVNSAAISLE